MKTPENRQAFALELRKAIDDALCYDTSIYTAVRHSTLQNASISITEEEIEHGDKCVSVTEWGNKIKKLEISFEEHAEELTCWSLCKDGKRKYEHCINFNDYKTKTTCFMAIAAYIVRYFD